jgi:YHS domain-containing protein
MIFDTQPFAVQTRKQPGETAIDPVCHMTVDKAAAAATRSFAGNTYYFCNPGCADAFEREPEKYLVESLG